MTVRGKRTLRRIFFDLLLGMAAVMAGAPLVSAEPSETSLSVFLRQQCADCHSGQTAEAGLDVLALPEKFDDVSTFAKWERLHDRVASGEMPPPDASTLSETEKKSFLSPLADQLTKAHQARKGTVLRRLNRQEYENTVNDLLGTNLRLREYLPQDGISEHFDTIGDSLGMSSVAMQRYIDAAEIALSTAIRHEERPETTKQELLFTKGRQASNIGKHWHQLPSGEVVFFTSGGYPTIGIDGNRINHPGWYKLTLRGFAHQTDKPVLFNVQVGSFQRGGSLTTQATLELAPPASAGAEPQEVEALLWFEHGEFWRLNPNLNPKGRQTTPAENPNPGIALGPVTLEGPLLAEWPPRGHRLLFGDLPSEPVEKDPKKQRRGNIKRTIATNDPEADSRRLLNQFATAAYRRPATEEELKPFLALYRSQRESGANFEQAMRTAATAILCSPGFLFFREPERGPLDDDALATRLSYFLSRSAPDEELLQTAQSGKLRDPKVLKQQTDRLLASPHSERFIRDFSDGWLNLREIDFTTPDRALYPEFDAFLKSAMLEETHRFLTELFRRDLNTLCLVDTDFAILNRRLAEHYGLEWNEGMGFHQVTLPEDSHRGGLITQASILKVSANGTNTSPVTRGAWVAERILGVEVPPPPPGIPGVEPDIRGARTIREQLALHRNSTNCNSCHRVIDPPGFALERFDVIGGYRDNYRTKGEGKRVAGKQYRIGPAIDASGEFADGESFPDFDAFRVLLKKRNRDITRCVAVQLLTFGTGRKMGFSDRPEIDALVDRCLAQGGGMKTLLHEVVQSPIFRSK